MPLIEANNFENEETLMDFASTHQAVPRAKPTEAEIIEKLELDVAQLRMELARSKEQLCSEIMDLRTEKETLQKEICRLNKNIKDL